MGFEQAKFGDGSASGSGNVTTAVSQHYGAFEGGKTTGVKSTDGAMNELTFDIDGEMLGNGDFDLVPAVIPAGSIIESAYIETTEAFVLGGTTPTVLVGTDTSEVTNGLVITKFQSETVRSFDVTSTLTGTWAAGLEADTTVGLALGGTTPTTTTAGKLRLVVRYIKQ